MKNVSIFYNLYMQSNMPTVTYMHLIQCKHTNVAQILSTNPDMI